MATAATALDDATGTPEARASLLGSDRDLDRDHLTSYFNHAGSAYALAGVTLGPRAGLFGCWTLLATYSCFIAANIAEIGLFGAWAVLGAAITLRLPRADSADRSGALGGRRLAL
jgi:hypothetical protein